MNEDLQVNPNITTAGSVTYTLGGSAENSYYPEEVHIRKVNNGFIIQVGCQRFVAETWQKVTTGLGDYFKDPKKAEKKYTNKKG